LDGLRRLTTMRITVRKSAPRGRAITHNDRRWDRNEKSSLAVRGRSRRTKAAEIRAGKWSSKFLMYVVTTVQLSVPKRPTFGVR
jgi:hypothetical protein